MRVQPGRPTALYSNIAGERSSGRKKKVLNVKSCSQKGS